MRPWTSRPAASAGSSRTSRRRRAASARERGALDTLVEHHFAVEGPVDRALGGDDAQALDLLVAQVVGQPQHELELGGTAALRGRVLAYDLDAADVPALALGVHLHRHRGARREARGQQLLRARRRVLTPDVGRLVGGEIVPADLDDV